MSKANSAASPYWQILLAVTFGIGLLSARTAYSAAGPRGSAASAERARVRAEMSRLPLSFEVNRGQAAPGIRFLSRGSGYTFAVTQSEAIVALSAPRGKGDKSPPRSSLLRMRLVGGNPKAVIAGEGSISGKSNYLIGRDRAKWHTGIPNYSKLRWSNAYPGIDLVYYGNQNELEHDFVVAPGRNVRTVKLEYAGADRVSIDPNGDLLLQTPAGTVRQKRPVAYQLIGARRAQVAAAYDLLGGRRVGFRVGAYDPTRPLVVDPVLAFSTMIGGHSDDYGFDIKVDAQKNTYVTGYTGSFTQAADNRPTQVPAAQGGPFPRIQALTAFPTASALMTDPDAGSVSRDLSNPANGTIDGTWAYSPYDGFVTKFGPLGSTLVYSTYLGGLGDDFALGLALDSTGAVYVTGTTFSDDFPLAGSPEQSFNAGAGDAFVAKLAPNGGSLLYSTYLGGFDEDRGRSIAVDSSGQAYVAGLTVSGDFPVSLGAFQQNPGGGSDAFVAGVASDGGLVYSTFLGGSGDEEGLSGAVPLDYTVPNAPFRNSQTPVSRPLGADAGIAIAADAAGNVTVAGGTASANFPVSDGVTVGTSAAFQAVKAAGLDAFVSRFNAQGDLTYSTFLGGAGDDAARGVALDGSSNAYLTGFSTSANFPTVPPPGATIPAYRATNAGAADAFVTRLNSNGQALGYSTYLGGGGIDVGNAIGLTSGGEICVAGTTASANFPVLAFLQRNLRGPSDVFATKYTASGADYLYSTYLGGSGVDRALGLAVGAFGQVFLTGVSSSVVPGSTLFPTTQGRLSAGTFLAADAWAAYPAGDAFVSRIEDAPPLAPSNLIATNIQKTQISLAWTDNSYNEVSFQVQMARGNGPFVVIGTVPTDTTTFVATGLVQATTYSFRVRALTFAGSSPFSNVLTVATLGTAARSPSDFAVTVVPDTTSLRISWTDANAELPVVYSLYRSDDGGTTWILVATINQSTPGGANTYTDSGLAGNTSHQYKLETSRGPGSVLTTRGPLTGLTLPSQPSGLTLTVPTTGSPRRGRTQIDMSWTDNSATPTAFRVEVSLNNSTWTTAGTTAVGVTTFTATGLTENTTYFFRVRGTNASGAGQVSAVASATTLRVPPVAPANLILRIVSDVQIDLTWADRSNDESSFRIERKTAKTAFAQIGSTAANVTTFSDTGLTANTTYAYRVFAVNNGGDSLPSNQASASTPPPPIAPTNLRATAVSSSRIDLVWGDNFSYESGFRIERLAPSGSFVEIKTVGRNVTVFSDTNLSPGKTYTYRVRAFVNDFGGTTRFTEYSNIASATTRTLPLAPSNLSATALSSTQIRLTWKDNSGNEDGFRIERKLAGGSYREIAVVGPRASIGGQVTYTDSGLRGATTYLYRVRAYKGAENSAYSNEASTSTL